MASEIASDVCTIVAETLLGKTCRRIVRRWPAPTARTASTYCSVETASTELRMMRAKMGT